MHGPVVVVVVVVVVVMVTPENRPLKLRAVRVVKVRETGVKVKPARLGVTVHVGPTSNPVWAQNPPPSVCTGSGTTPLPPTQSKVIVTPGRPMPRPVTMPATGYGRDA